jgi:hypothetical protein
MGAPVAGLLQRCGWEETAVVAGVVVYDTQGVVDTAEEEDM